MSKPTATTQWKDASDFLNGRARNTLDEKDLETFIKLLDEESDQTKVKAAIEHLLRVVEVEPYQARRLADEKCVQASPDLAQALLLYVRNQQYQDEENASGSASNLFYIFGLFVAPALWLIYLWLA